MFALAPMQPSPPTPTWPMEVISEADLAAYRPAEKRLFGHYTFVRLDVGPWMLLDTTHDDA